MLGRVYFLHCLRECSENFKRNTENPNSEVSFSQQHSLSTAVVNLPLPVALVLPPQKLHEDILGRDGAAQTGHQPS